MMSDLCKSIEIIIEIVIKHYQLIRLFKFRIDLINFAKPLPLYISQVWEKK